MLGFNQDELLKFPMKLDVCCIIALRTNKAFLNRSTFVKSFLRRSDGIAAWAASLPLPCLIHTSPKTCQSFPKAWKQLESSAQAYRCQATLVMSEANLNILIVFLPWINLPGILRFYYDPYSANAELIPILITEDKRKEKK